jgi:hypothetical protein
MRCSITATAIATTTTPRNYGSVAPSAGGGKGRDAKELDPLNDVAFYIILR